MRDIPFYLLAVLLGIGAGVLEVRFEDLLTTALVVLVATMLLGLLRPRFPWRWTLIVGACVPLVQLWAYVFRTEHASRAELWESGLGFLTGIAGAYCGSFTRKAVHELFGSKGRSPQ